MSQNNLANVELLTAITPTTDSSRQDRILYAYLNPARNEYNPLEYTRMAQFWDAEPGSLEEEESARQLALHYMVIVSAALNESASVSEIESLSKWYTRASGELYGTPNAEIAKRLYDDQQCGVETEVPFEHAARELGRFIDTKYNTVFAALEVDLLEDRIEPDEVAYRFEAALAVLESEHDAAWSEWSVERNQTDKLSVNRLKKLFGVGMKRAAISPQQLRALFSHEVLDHGLRAINGLSLSEELSKGLPGYIEAEEGLGIFIEFAISGTIKDVVYDRYVDIAFALGLIDGVEHTRAELIEKAMSRAKRRNKSTEKTTRSEEDLIKEVYAHVNRIYRGSRGDENIGVFTKDMAYYEGFLKIGNYIEHEMVSGKTMEDIWEFLMIGKFDPTNRRHLVYIQQERVK